MEIFESSYFISMIQKVKRLLLKLFVIQIHPCSDVDAYCTSVINFIVMSKLSIMLIWFWQQIFLILNRSHLDAQLHKYALIFIFLIEYIVQIQVLIIVKRSL